MKDLNKILTRTKTKNSSSDSSLFLDVVYGRNGPIQFIIEGHCSVYGFR